AFAVLSPLLLHFTLVFPERGSGVRAPSTLLVAAMYLPAFLLISARIIALVQASQGTLSGPGLSATIDVLDRGEQIYLFACSMAAIFVLTRAFGRITSITARRQLRWIAWGTALGAGPFAIGYALPWAFGWNPPLAFQLTAIPLGVLPATYASAIIRY